jgi:predicted DNA-binding transcriptional regulator AlpA
MNKYFNIVDFCREVGISRPAFYRRQKKGTVPNPIISKGKVYLFSKEQVNTYKKQVKKEKNPIK